MNSTNTVFGISSYNSSITCHKIAIFGAKNTPIYRKRPKISLAQWPRSPATFCMKSFGSLSMPKMESLVRHCFAFEARLMLRKPWPPPLYTFLCDFAKIRPKMGQNMPILGQNRKLWQLNIWSCDNSSNFLFQGHLLLNSWTAPTQFSASLLITRALHGTKLPFWSKNTPI